jgi:hypothetical protein
MALRGVARMRRAAIAAGAGRERAQQIDLGEELDEVARPDRARLHEILVRVPREAGAHEDVEHVVHVPLGLAQGQSGMHRQRAGEIRMATVMIFGPAEEQLRVGIASRPDDVVNAAAVFVEAVPVERIVRDRRHRPQIRQRAP